MKRLPSCIYRAMVSALFDAAMRKITQKRNTRGSVYVTHYCVCDSVRLLQVTIMGTSPTIGTFKAAAATLKNIELYRLFRVTE